MKEIVEMKIVMKQLRQIIKEEIAGEIVPEVQAFVDENQFLKGNVVSQADLIEAGPYVIYASADGLKHIKDRHATQFAPGSLINPGTNLRELIAAVASTPPTHRPGLKSAGGSGGMAKWEGVKSPRGAIGQMGLAVGTPDKVAAMKSYTMPGGRGEVVKIAPGVRKPTDEVTLVTALLGDLSDGRQALSLITLFPGGMEVDGVTIPRDRGDFADAGIYFILPPNSPLLSDTLSETSKITERWQKLAGVIEG